MTLPSVKAQRRFHQAIHMFAEPALVFLLESRTSQNIGRWQRVGLPTSLAILIGGGDEMPSSSMCTLRRGSDVHSCEMMALFGTRWRTWHMMEARKTLLD
jgi:hypothetical protein